MGTALLMTQGTGGDLYPFLQIGRGLRARGHQVTFITEPKFEAEVRREGFEFASMLRPGHVEPTAEDFVADQQDGNVIKPRILDVCMHIYNTIKERRGPGGTVLISHYNLNLMGQMAAELLGLPYVTIFTAPYFLMKMPFIEQVYVSESNILNEYRTYLGLRPVRDWREWLKEPRWVMGLWPEWFAPNDPSWMFDDVKPVGFVYDPGIETGGLSDEVEEFLDGKPTVLITHGTSKAYKIDFFSASAEACTTLGLKALLVTKFPDLVPSGLPDSVLWCKYLPFASAMPRMDAIIHHGGMGTTNQSLTAGVPQLVLGYGYDRPDNGMRVQNLRAGEYLPSIRWQSGPIVESLRRIMTPEVRQRCRDLAQRQERVADPAAVACDVIESSIRETGGVAANGA